MKWIFAFFIFIIFFQIISAQCGEGQIDINSATKEELENLSGIGPIKAQAIIDARPFNSIDDLDRVKGIGNITLNNIKIQGLACVDFQDGGERKSENQQADENKENNETENGQKYENTNSFERVLNYSVKQETKKSLEPIILNPKSDENIIKSSNEENKNYSVYGLIVFSIFIGILFFLKRKKQKRGFE